MSIGTSRRGPITVANACFELIPNMAIATAIASSKSFDEAATARDTCREMKVF
jgi:hypothetical protein